ncbi:hypothetical protein LCGC14_1715390 [marine sediment metagenome]|uniref:Uncharacterized protein n=1 Tax=marine sediment metagenome TaxID=412755 RepID=A0A0F9JUK0_9ZZZZ
MNLQPINPNNRQIGSHILLARDGAHYNGPWAQLHRDWHLTNAQGHLLPSDHETRTFREKIYNRIKDDPRFINAYRKG